MNNFVMEVLVKKEAGYEEALEGLSLSYNIDKTIEELNGIARKLNDKDFGHNKYLESIICWVLVKCPRYMHQEADTYRISTKQSESTIHTLKKCINSYTNEDIYKLFEPGSVTDDVIDRLKFHCSQEGIDHLSMAKRILPEGFLQTRMWCLSYKTLRNIILQRYTHPLPHWKSFITQILEQVQHPEFLPNPYLKSTEGELPNEN